MDCKNVLKCPVEHIMINARNIKSIKRNSRILLIREDSKVSSDIVVRVKNNFLLKLDKIMNRGRKQWVSFLLGWR